MSRHACTRHFYIYYALYYVFLMSSYIFKMFLLDKIGKLTIVKPMLWNCRETVWTFLKMLWRKTVETQDGHNVVSTSLRCLYGCHLTMVNMRFYEDILDVYWSVPFKNTIIYTHYLVCTDSVYLILGYLLSMLAILNLLW